LSPPPSTTRITSKSGVTLAAASETCRQNSRMLPSSRNTGATIDRCGIVAPLPAHVAPLDDTSVQLDVVDQRLGIENRAIPGYRDCFRVRFDAPVLQGVVDLAHSIFDRGRSFVIQYPLRLGEGYVVVAPVGIVGRDIDGHRDGQRLTHDERQA